MPGVLVNCLDRQTERHVHTYVSSRTYEGEGVFVPKITLGTFAISLRVYSCMKTEDCDILFCSFIVESDKCSCKMQTEGTVACHWRQWLHQPATFPVLL